MRDNNDNSDNRGLASASKATRQRVAREGGIASGEARRRRRSSRSNSSDR